MLSLEPSSLSLIKFNYFMQAPYHLQTAEEVAELIGMLSPPLQCIYFLSKNNG